MPPELTTMHCYASAFENGEAALLTSIRSCVVVESLTFQVASLRAVVTWISVMPFRNTVGRRYTRPIISRFCSCCIEIVFNDRISSAFRSCIFQSSSYGVKASPLFSVSWKSVWLITRKEYNQRRTILGIVMASGCVRRLYFMRSGFALLRLYSDVTANNVVYGAFLYWASKPLCRCHSWHRVISGKVSLRLW